MTCHDKIKYPCYNPLEIPYHHPHTHTTHDTIHKYGVCAHCRRSFRWCFFFFSCCLRSYLFTVSCSLAILAASASASSVRALRTSGGVDMLLMLSGVRCSLRRRGRRGGDEGEALRLQGEALRLLLGLGVGGRARLCLPLCRLPPSASGFLGCHPCSSPSSLPHCEPSAVCECVWASDGVFN